jgi:predicted dehydrogenase
MDKSLLRVLIVGCGNIAGKFDEVRGLSDSPYTHVGAYLMEGRYEVVSCVEPDDFRREEFMRFWSVKSGYRSILDLLDGEERFDVISICSPTHCHANDIKVALDLKPKLIFCEKPITYSINESEELISKARNRSVLLAVNYSRRFDKDVQDLKDKIGTSLYGELRSIVGVYNKGILNNGSHMLDMLHFILGPLVVKTVGSPIYDFFEDDPTIPVNLEDSRGVPIQLVCGNAKDYSFFELTFIFSSGVITMEEGGMFWRKRFSEYSLIFNGYKTLDAGERIIGRYPKAMLNAVTNLADVIESGKVLLSSADTALSVQKICDQIKQMALKT